MTRSPENDGARLPETSQGGVKENAFAQALIALLHERELMNRPAESTASNPPATAGIPVTPSQEPARISNSRPSETNGRMKMEFLPEEYQESAIIPSPKSPPNRPLVMNHSMRADRLNTILLVVTVLIFAGLLLFVEFGSHHPQTWLHRDVIVSNPILTTPTPASGETGEENAADGGDPSLPMSYSTDTMDQRMREVRFQREHKKRAAAAADKPSGPAGTNVPVTAPPGQNAKAPSPWQEPAQIHGVTMPLKSYDLMGAAEPGVTDLPKNNPASK